MSVEMREAVERLVLQVVAAVNNRALYPSAHPRTREAVEQLVTGLDRVLEQRGQSAITLLAVDDDLVVDQRPLAQGGLTVRGFVHALRRLDVEGLTLSRGLTREETLRFLEAIAERSTAVSTDHIQVGRLRLGLESLEEGGAAGGPGLGGESGAGSEAGGAGESSAGERGGRQSAGAPKGQDVATRLVVVAEQAAAVYARLRQQRSGAAQLEKLVWAAMDALAQSADVLLPLGVLRGHDELTYVHSLHVALLTLAHGRALGLRGEALKDVGLGALLHDVGKLALPVELLHKPGPLAPAEWTLLRQHPELGAALLCEQRELSSVVLLVAYEHHLRFDGLPSYPLLRAPRRATLASSLTAVADTFDSFCGRNPTPPRRAAAFTMLRRRAGTVLDPVLVESFCRLFGPEPAGTAAAG